MSTATMEKITHKVVSPAEWLAARKEFLKKEKELVHLRDELSRQRREMPWERVEKKYTFEGANGAKSLADLFDGRSSAHRLSLHVRPGLEGRMSQLFVSCGLALTA